MEVEKAIITEVVRLIKEVLQGTGIRLDSIPVGDPPGEFCFIDTTWLYPYPRDYILMGCRNGDFVVEWKNSPFSPPNCYTEYELANPIFPNNLIEFVQQKYNKEIQ